MAATKIEQSTQRLQEKINSSNRYLKKEVYDINELQKLWNKLKKKGLQRKRNKDLKEYEELPDKDNKNKLPWRAQRFLQQQVSIAVESQ